MATDRSAEMSDEAVRTFLDRGGTGVLSLAAGDEPYATPVSYGYDADARAFYFRLGFGADSEKRRFIEPSTRARLVIYDRDDETWRSVIATGTLQRIADDELTVDIATGLREADLPLFDSWDEPLAEVEFELYRLDISTLSGRTAAPAHSG